MVWWTPAVWIYWKLCQSPISDFVTVFSCRVKAYPSQSWECKQRFKLWHNIYVPMLTVRSMLSIRKFLNKLWAEILACAWLYCYTIFCWKASGIEIPTFYKYANQHITVLSVKNPDIMTHAHLMYWNQQEWRNHLKCLILLMQICLMQILPKLKTKKTNLYLHRYFQPSVYYTLSS